MARPDGPAREGAFISYARTDGEAAARALQQKLREEAPDLHTWLDRAELEGGVGWWSQIERELDRAEFLIVVMTPAALRSANTRREWRAARQRGVCVYPVKGPGVGGLAIEALPLWMRKAHFYDTELEWPKLVAHLRRGCRATRVPFMAPMLTGAYVPRPREALALRQALLPGAAGARLVALRGSGGYGKTTLAAALCHDDEVIEAFDDGILWVTLGQTPNLHAELVKLYAALTGSRPGFVDAEDAARELAIALENKNCLLVLDDVWKTAHAQPLLACAAGCAKLITTRTTDAVPDAQRVPIDKMTPDEASALLLARLGAPLAPDPSLRGLVERLGEWPLPIKLAGSAMRQRIDRGESQADALAYVFRALERRGVAAFDERDSDQRSDAVGLTIQLSLDMLGADDQRRCAELAVFRAGAPVPISVAGRLWELDEIDCEDLARRLDDLALLDFDLRRGSLLLHDLLRGWFAGRLADPAAVHARIVDGWGEARALPEAYAWRHYAYHLIGANRGDQLGRLLLSLSWLQAKLDATDVHALLADFELAPAGDALASVRGAIGLAAPALAAHPAELRSQLIGRLASGELPEVARLVQAARSIGGATSLKPLQATLDRPGGMLEATWVGHRGEVSCLAIDVSGKTLISGSRDGCLRLWSMADGKPQGETVLSNLGIRALAAIAPSGHMLVGTAEGRIMLVDPASPQTATRLPTPDRSAITAAAASANGRMALCATRDGQLWVWDLPEHRLVHALGVHKLRFGCAAISADGRRGATGSDDGLVRIWDLPAGRLELEIAAHDADVNAVVFAPDGGRVLSGSTDRSLVLWSAESGQALWTVASLPASVTALAIDAQGRNFIAGSSDGSARMGDLASGKLLAALDGHTDAVGAVVIDAAGERAATGSADRSIKLWRLGAIAPASSAAVHKGAVVWLAIDARGELCASGGADGRVLVRELASGRVVREIAAHAGPVRSLAFSGDSSCVLSGGIDGQYRMWSVDTGEGYPILVRHAAPIGYCALGPNARYLVTTCRDQFVYVWEVPSGTLIARYGTRRLFDHLIEPAPRRLELPADDELADRYLAGETVFEVAIVRMSTDGRQAVLSATAHHPGMMRGPADGKGTGPGAGTPAQSCLLVFEIETGSIRTVTSSQTDPIAAYAVDASATRLLWARADGALELWDLIGGVRMAVLHGHADKVNAIAFGAGPGRAYSCGRDRTLWAWDLDSNRPLATFTADAALRSLAVAPDGITLAAGDVAGRVHGLRFVEAVAAGGSAAAIHRSASPG